jgi:hypothetical protein
MTGESKQPTTQYVLHNLFSKLGKRELGTLETYVKQHDLMSLLQLYLEDPEFRYKESALEETEKRKLRLLRRIGAVDYVVDTESVKGGLQDYIWVFKRNVYLAPLKKTFEYVNPLKPLLDRIDVAYIPDSRFNLRLRSIMGTVASLGDITKKQRKELKDLIKAVITLAKTGKDAYGKPIGPEYIRPFFYVGLGTIGINNKVGETGEVRLVYNPSVLPKPMTLEELKESMARRNAPPAEAKKTAQEIVLGATVTTESMSEETIGEVLRPSKRATERIINRHHEEPKVERPKAEKPKTHRERKVKPLKETLASQVLKEMLPGLLSSQPNELKIQTERVETLNRHTVSKLEQRITEVDIQEIIALPPYVYTEYASVYETTVKDFSETYEKRLKDYVGGSKYRMSLLESENFYRIAKTLPKMFDKESFGESELSQLVLSTYGIDLSAKVITKNISPLVKVGLVARDRNGYKLNKNFLEKTQADVLLEAVS